MKTKQKRERVAKSVLVLARLIGLLSLMLLDNASAEQNFRRGDANDDGKIDIADSVYITNWLYRGGPAPSCVDAADTNDDGQIDLSDVIYIINWQFNIDNPDPPPDPFPDCGNDPTSDALGPCDSNCPETPPAPNTPKSLDFNLDGHVNKKDYSIFASAWLTTQGDPLWNPSCDLDIPYDLIDIFDLAVFVDGWLTGCFYSSFTHVNMEYNLKPGTKKLINIELQPYHPEYGTLMKVWVTLLMHEVYVQATFDNESTFSLNQNFSVIASVTLKNASTSYLWAKLEQEKTIQTTIGGDDEPLSKPDFTGSDTILLSETFHRDSITDFLNDSAADTLELQYQVQATSDSSEVFSRIDSRESVTGILRIKSLYEYCNP